MASSGSDISSDEIYYFKCSPCLDDNRHREAAKYCVECQGYFCQPCAEMFHKLPGLKAHKFLDQTNYKSTSVLGRLPAIPTQTCSVHETKIVDMYCGNHDEVACTSCMTLNHRSCSDVKSIPDIVDNAPKMPDIKRMNQKLKDLKKLKENVVDTKRIQRETLKKSKLDAVTAIRKYRKDLDAFLDNIEKESISEVLEVFQKVDQGICQDKTETENEIDLLERLLNDLKQSEGNNAKLFVSLKMTASYISKIDDATTPEQPSSETRITYNFNPTILTTLQNLKTFGSALQPRTATSLVWSVECIKDFDISLQSDTGTCDTYGTCLTTNGFLLLSDYTNKKLKRADIQNMSVKAHCSLPGAPFGVCCTRDSEAAVCINNNSVQFVSLNSQLTLTRNMKLNHRCFGIAYKDQKLYITDNERSLYIHDLTGNLLQVVDQDSNRKTIFNFPRSIAFSDVDDKMFVASWGEGLVFLDGKGNYSQTLIDPELQTVSSVCIDGKGALFISGFHSDNIIQIGSDGKKIGVIIKSSDGLQCPENICFDKRKRILLISQRNANIVKVALLK